MIFQFVKKYFTQIVLVFIAILLVVLAVQLSTEVSVQNAVEMDALLQLLRELGMWGVLFTLVGVVGYIAITGGNSQSAIQRLDDFQKSDYFTELERQFENAPAHVKKLAETGTGLLKIASSLLNSPALDKITDVVEDLQDGVEPPEVVTDSEQPQ